ncbi:Uncharacterized protein FKW44_006496, partial [Caligus rogercresseyi]
CDRSANKSRGKGKKGAQSLNPEANLCLIKPGQGGEPYFVKALVKGKLLERHSDIDLKALDISHSSCPTSRKVCTSSRLLVHHRLRVMLAPASSLSLLTGWLVEAALKLESRSKLLKILGKRIPHFWQRIHKHKIWYLTLLTLDNILVHMDQAAHIFSNTDFLMAFTTLLEDIFKNNPFLFCGANQEQIRSDGRALLKSLRCILNVAEQRTKLASGIPLYSGGEDLSALTRLDLASKKIDEDLRGKSKAFWNTIVENSEKTFSVFVSSVLDPPTLSVLFSIRKVIQENVISGRTRLEAFFDRGWEDYVHTEDKVFQGLVDIRKKYSDYKGINADIIIDIIYLLYALEKKDVPIPSNIPLLNPSKELY